MSMPTNPANAGSLNNRGNSNKADYTWIGNLVATLGLIIGVFIVLANRQPPKDKLHVEPATIQQLAQVSSTAATPIREETLASIEWPKSAPPFATVPMTADEIESLQQHWADYLGIPVEIKTSVGTSMVLVPPGDFRMGGTESQLTAGFGVVKQDDAHWMSCYKSASPQHDVRITRPYYISKYEITQREFEAVMQVNPSWHASTGKEAYYRDQMRGMDTAAHPVEGVTWLDCVRFCNRLSELENKSPSYQATSQGGRPDYKTTFAAGYRLPTEAEWEMACRAGTDSRFWTGEEPIDPEQAGWHGKIHGSRSHKVGELKGNALGVHDMCHNVWEWVDDCFAPEYYAECSEKVTYDPIGSSEGTMRIVRGGMWPYADTAAFDRYAYHNDFHCNYVGFRLVLPIPSNKLPAPQIESAPAPID